jgi:hypothetical protein
VAIAAWATLLRRTGLTRPVPHNEEADHYYQEDDKDAGKGVGEDIGPRHGF